MVAGCWSVLKPGRPVRRVTPFALDSVFLLRVGDRLPLHVASQVVATARERLDVVDHVARACP